MLFIDHRNTFNIQMITLFFQIQCSFIYMDIANLPSKIATIKAGFHGDGH